jgi:tetratricopeptide (TPR) repeat protein
VPSWSYPTAGPSKEVGNIRRREFVSPAGPAPAAPASGSEADHHIACARQAWDHDRNLAVRHLFEALRLDPRHTWANYGLADYFFEIGMLPEALEHSARAADGAPEDLPIAALRLLVLDAAGRVDEATRLIEQHFDAGRTTPELVMLFARVATRTKREAEAVERIETMLQGPSLLPPQRKGLHMSAAALLDRLGRYDDAFDHARLGHAAHAPAYDPHAFRRMMAQQRAWYTRERLRSLPTATHGWGQPVFIVGMPRSGTSLVEQILDRHPSVRGAGELLDLTHVLRHTAQQGGGGGGGGGSGSDPGAHRAFLERATPAQLDAVAGLYLSRVASFAPNARYITDKQPFNWMWLGLVSRLFPSARVIHVVRDPLDTCVSGYLTHFNESVLHASDLAHLGMNYADQTATMAHWRQVLDLPILEVSYEAVVAEPEAQVRRMLEFLDLPWDPACVRFHESDRYVATASMHQVRRPLYSSSVGRWRHYEKHLGPLREGLEAS